jgi:hypothetical protein
MAANDSVQWQRRPRANTRRRPEREEAVRLHRRRELQPLPGRRRGAAALGRLSGGGGVGEDGVAERGLLERAHPLLGAEAEPPGRGAAGSSARGRPCTCIHV